MSRCPRKTRRRRPEYRSTKSAQTRSKSKTTQRSRSGPISSASKMAANQPRSSRSPIQVNRASRRSRSATSRHTRPRSVIYREITLKARPSRSGMMQAPTPGAYIASDRRPDAPATQGSKAVRPQRASGAAPAARIRRTVGTCGRGPRSRHLRANRLPSPWAAGRKN